MNESISQLINQSNSQSSHHCILLHILQILNLLLPLSSQVWHWCIYMMTQRVSRTASSSSCLMESTSSRGTYWSKWCLSTMRNHVSLGIWYKTKVISPSMYRGWKNSRKVKSKSKDNVLNLTQVKLEVFSQKWNQIKVQMLLLNALKSEKQIFQMLRLCSSQNPGRILDSFSSNITQMKYK